MQFKIKNIIANLGDKVDEMSLTMAVVQCDDNSDHVEYRLFGQELSREQYARAIAAARSLGLPEETDDNFHDMLAKMGISPVEPIKDETSESFREIFKRTINR